MKTKILNHKQVEHKIKRIAYQIAEAYMGHEQIILAGITGGGYTFAQKLKKELTIIGTSNITLCKVSMDKQNPRSGVKTDVDPADYTNKGVVLCDDVLNSGTTLIYGIKHFLDVPLTKFKTAVLVNRNHKKYPVKADFKGISLSTTMEEHVLVSLDSKDYSVHLA